MRLAEKLARGEIVEQVLDSARHLGARERLANNRDERTRVQFTRCTESQMVLYLTREGAPIAICHQYRRRDGTLAGSGRANPHTLFMPDGEVQQVDLGA